MSQEQKQQPPKQWTKLQTFVEPGSDLAVCVQVSNDERPIYSWQTGRVYQDRFMLHHRNRYSTKDGWVTLERIDTALLARLIERAQDFIQLAHQEQQDAAVKQRDRRDLGNKPRRREASGANRDYR